MKFTKDPASKLGGTSGETEIVLRGRPLTGFESSMMVVGFWTTAWYTGKVVGTVIREALEVGDDED